MSADIGWVVENNRRGTRIGCETAGTRLRKADELLVIIAVVCTAVLMALEEGI
jgi:hypothetical protein